MGYEKWATQPKDKHFDHKEVYENIRNLNKRLSKIIERKKPSEFSDIDLEISALMHQMAYFYMLFELSYPLKKLYSQIRLNPNNLSSDEVIEAFVTSVDLNFRKSFLVLTAFSFETLLGVIAKKYSISFEDCHSMNQKYMKVIDYFKIDCEECEDLIKIFHYIRNTLHSGTHVTKNSEPLQYKGRTFIFEIGQEHVEPTIWNYFTFFASEIIGIF